MLDEKLDNIVANCHKIIDKTTITTINGLRAILKEAPCNNDGLGCPWPDKIKELLESIVSDWEMNVVKSE